MRQSLLIAFLWFGFQTDALSAQCVNKGVERWTVKTTAPLKGSKVRRFTALEFARLAPPVRIDESGQKKLDSRYAEQTPDGLREGQLVSVAGWVQLIKTSPDDCDYHIQLTPTKDGGSGTIVVEMPRPDAGHVTSTALRKRLGTEHDSIWKQLRLTKEPGGHTDIGGRAYMEFTGALFFDGPHHPHCDARATGTPAVTCWEVHPVTLSHFVRRP